MSKNRYEKVAFLLLFLVLWALQILEDEQVYPTLTVGIFTVLGETIFSVLPWSIFGYILGGVYSFFHNIVQPGKGYLTVWQKVNLGLLAGIILKPWFGIQF